MVDVKPSTEPDAGGVSPALRTTPRARPATAQVVGIAQNEKYQENKIDERHRDHALFIAFAPADPDAKPRSRSRCWWRTPLGGDGRLRRSRARCSLLPARKMPAAPAPDRRARRTVAAASPATREAADEEPAMTHHRCRSALGIWLHSSSLVLGSGAAGRARLLGGLGLATLYSARVTTTRAASAKQLRNFALAAAVMLAVAGIPPRMLKRLACRLPGRVAAAGGRAGRRSLLSLICVTSQLQGPSPSHTMISFVARSGGLVTRDRLCQSSPLSLP